VLRSSARWRPRPARIGREGLSRLHSIGQRSGDDALLHVGQLAAPEADPKSPAKEIHFEFAGETNLDPAKDKHMHEGTVRFVDDDHIEIYGVAWENGKHAKGHECPMKLIRKK
jgi:hypothetical protein